MSNSNSDMAACGLKRIMKKHLNLARLGQISTLFSERGWDDMAIPANKLRYDNFCSSFGQLKDDEFQLIMELTSRFHCMTFIELVEEFLSGYYSVPDNIIQRCHHLLIVPMKKMYRSGRCMRKFKSGDMLMAQMQQVDDICYYNDKFVYCKNAIEVARNYQQGDLVCFIDDFVGTGRTFYEAYQTTCNYLSTHNIALSTVDCIGVSAWAMRQGLLACQARGLRLYSFRVFQKEISDFYPRPQNMAHLLRMYNMEKTVCDKITGKFRFGFGHCEALVSIAGRCANNTFPVYWKTRNATFPR